MRRGASFLTEAKVRLAKTPTNLSFVLSLSLLSRPLAALLILLAFAGCGDDDRSDGGVEDGGSDTSVDATTDPTSDARPQSPATLRVATWNVENLFDARNDPDTFDDVYSTSEMNAKINALAAVLQEIDADVVALQEVENEFILGRLAEATGLGYTEQVLMDGFDPRGIDVACLSKRPIIRAVSHQGERFDSPESDESYFYTRDALEIFVDAGGQEVGIVVLHLRSMVDGGDDHRLAEATYTERIVSQRISATTPNMIIAGDLNDFPDSPTLDALIQDGPMLDLTLGVPEADRYTFVFRGREQQIDYILGTASVLSARENIEIIHTSQAQGASDHAPIVADFRFE